MKTLIRGGKIVTETEVYQGDILIGDGKISEVLRNEKNRPQWHLDKPTRPI